MRQGCVGLRSCAAVWMWGLALAVLAPSGCAAIKATEQPGKKDLKVLSPGTPRCHLIAELGAPMWTDERDGTITDVFAFKQGYTKGVKAGRALIHGAADVATGGLWEVIGIPAESLADGRDVKVQITYDERRSVRDIEVLQGEDVIHPRRLFGRKRKAAPAAPARLEMGEPLETMARFDQGEPDETK